MSPPKAGQRAAGLVGHLAGVGPGAGHCPLEVILFPIVLSPCRVPGSGSAPAPHSGHRGQGTPKIPGNQSPAPREAPGAASTLADKTELSPWVPGSLGTWVPGSRAERHPRLRPFEWEVPQARPQPGDPHQSSVSLAHRPQHLPSAIQGVSPRESAVQPLVQCPAQCCPDAAPTESHLQPGGIRPNSLAQGLPTHSIHVCTSWPFIGSSGGKHQWVHVLRTGAEGVLPRKERG